QKYHGVDLFPLSSSHGQRLGHNVCILLLGSMLIEGETLMRRTTLGLVGLLSITSIASAADLPVRAPAPAAVVAPVYSWTGFYIGGHVGGLWTKADARLDPLPDVLTFGTFANSGDVDDSAFVGGLHAGYNWQFAPLWV